MPVKRPVTTPRLRVDAGRGDFYAAVQLVRRERPGSVSELIELANPKNLTPEIFDALSDAFVLGRELNERQEP